MNTEENDQVIYDYRYLFSGLLEGMQAQDVKLVYIASLSNLEETAAFVNSADILKKTTMKLERP